MAAAPTAGDQPPRPPQRSRGTAVDATAAVPTVMGQGRPRLRRGGAPRPVGGRPPRRRPPTEGVDSLVPAGAADPTVQYPVLGRSVGGGGIATVATVAAAAVLPVNDSRSRQPRVRHSAAAPVAAPVAMRPITRRTAATARVFRCSPCWVKHPRVAAVVPSAAGGSDRGRELRSRRGWRVRPVSGVSVGLTASAAEAPIHPRHRRRRHLLRVVPIHVRAAGGADCDGSTVRALHHPNREAGVVAAGGVACPPHCISAAAAAAAAHPSVTGPKRAAARPGPRPPG